MHTVIVTAMTEALPIAQIVPEFGVCRYGMNVMSLEACGRPAHLTSMAVPLQYSCLPRQIVWTSPPLGALVGFPLRRALACNRAVDMSTGALGRTRDERDVANFTHIRGGSAAACQRAVHVTADQCRRSYDASSTGGARGRDLLRLLSSAAASRAEASLHVLGPRTARGLLYKSATRRARFQIHMSKGIIAWPT